MKYKRVLLKFYKAWEQQKLKKIGPNIKVLKQFNQIKLVKKVANILDNFAV